MKLTEYAIWSQLAHAYTRKVCACTIRAFTTQKNIQQKFMTIGKEIQSKRNEVDNYKTFRFIDDLAIAPKRLRSPHACASQTNRTHETSDTYKANYCLYTV